METKKQIKSCLIKAAQNGIDAAQKILNQVSGKEIIRAKVFIIPNTLYSKKAIWAKSEEEASEIFDKFVKSQHRDIDVPVGTQYVQIWVYNGDCDNLCRHHYLNGDDLPEYLPVSLFDGKKEGDVITFNSKWGRVELTLAQKNSRYERFGTFDSVLSALIRKDNELLPEWK